MLKELIIPAFNNPVFPAPITVTQGMTEPIIVVSSENQFVKKMEHFFCLE